MIKELIMRCGIVVFWAAWPFWFVYFKLHPQRTRVVIIAENKVLLVKSWLNSGSWGLPGGGAHKDEELTDAALREVQEEVGHVLAQKDMMFKETRRRSVFGLSYNAHYFVSSLERTFQPKLQRLEIAEAQWVPISALSSLKLDTDTAYVIKSSIILLKE